MHLHVQFISQYEISKLMSHASYATDTEYYENKYYRVVIKKKNLVYKCECL